MSAITPQPESPTRTAIKAVLIAGAGQIGGECANDLLDRLPLLRSPIIVCVRDTDISRLQARIDGVHTRWACDGAALAEASVWIAPPRRHTFVRDGRFEVSDAPGASPAEAPSLGKLYHSLRVDLGSRVFAVVIDQERANTPLLRLLAQRGARVVSPVDCGPDAVATHLTADEIVNHLRAALAAASEVAVA